ncbi:hypothetical protein D3OALGA1CA_5716 [Olavius algarvensis associated proteobacterium Delta 3]|nr:hypothetical protein D3OALGB2SA_2461 [Olavius algarvensis associated proteobacterium Delta 3]CAB5170770.1 hypothetical protein D3OALGA1CA_5716 [Olavius algarvensis associated proteobacterium Delta 3]
MEETKYFQFKMLPGAHARLKKAAKQVGLSKGKFIENLFSDYLFRLEEAFKIAGIIRDHSEYVPGLSLAMWAASQNGWPQKELFKRYATIGLAADEDEEWQPEIRISENRRVLSPEEIEQYRKGTNGEKDS